MSRQKNPDLVVLPDRMKEALKLINSRFPLDWDTAVVVKDGGTTHVKHADNEPKEAPIRTTNRYGGQLPQNAIDAQIRERQLQSEKAKVKNSEIVADVECAFAEDDIVKIEGELANLEYQVVKVMKLPYGRTGWWCKLKYRHSEAKCHQKPIEISRLIKIALEPVEAGLAC